MTDRTTYTTIQISDLAEGSREGSDGHEPISPLKTATLPVVHGDTHAQGPAAETGLVAQIRVEAEGKENDDAQDASLKVDETQPVTAAQPDVETPMPQSPSVLIIEDTTELAEIIQATLERMNIVTAHETHGAKALAKFDEMRPDVLLLDISLPDMMGWKILDTIKENQERGLYDKLPAIIVITAYGDPANRLVGKLQGVYSYLVKPFTTDEVEIVVSKAISGAPL